MVQRLTYQKRHSYATKSNQHRVDKTPGGKLVYQSTKMRASGSKCPVTGKKIQGGPAQAQNLRDSLVDTESDIVVKGGNDGCGMVKEGSHFGEDNGDGQSALYVVLLPILEGDFRAVLQGNSNNELEICLESGLWRDTC